jgi:hypothetical protein
MLPEFAQSLYQRFDREGIPLLLAAGLLRNCFSGLVRMRG